MTQLSRTLLFLSIPMIGFSQPSTYLRLGATPGAQITSWSNSIEAAGKPSSIGFSLGASAAWVHQRWSYSTEFSRATGSSAPTGRATHWETFSGGAGLAYQVLRSAKSRLELGATTGLLQTRLTQLSSSNAGVHRKRNDWIVQPTLGFYMQSPNNLIMGVRLGYAITPNNGRSWKDSFLDAGVNPTETRNNWTIQLLLGGLVHIKRS